MKSLPKPLIGLAAAGAATLIAANRLASAPPDSDVAARAEAAQYSGPWRHGYASVNGVRLHYAELGSGPLVILLHGFPECWYEWRHIIPHLAERFHVVAPDMRGYNWSGKPKGVGSYSAANVSADIAALVDYFGEARTHLVGHDWGGAIAWHFGMYYAHRLDRLAVINAPHPAAFARELKTRDQLSRSLYIFYFQLPLLPEASIRLLLRRTLTESARVPGAFSEDALDVYQNAISQPGAATAMLNYYRATFRTGPAFFEKKTRTITSPTLLLWGMQDFALSPQLTEGLEAWVPDLHVERIQDSGHWLPEEKPRLASDLLLDFLSV